MKRMRRENRPGNKTIHPSLVACLGVALLAITIVGLTTAGAAEDTPEVLLRKTYPNFTFESIEETEIKGLYEVIAGGNIIYWNPGTNYLIFGEIYTSEGKSITAERKNALKSNGIKNLPLDQAIKIGEGQNTVIEFMDPDCPFCRKASEFLTKRDDVTRYVFLVPLTEMHPQAEKKARYILCSGDEASAYEEVMSGTLDNKEFSACGEQSVSDKLKLHRDAAVKAGVQGTPTFWINGHPVAGANIPLITKYLANERR